MTSRVALLNGGEYGTEVRSVAWSGTGTESTGMARTGDRHRRGHDDDVGEIRSLIYGGDEDEREDRLEAREEADEVRSVIFGGGGDELREAIADERSFDRQLRQEQVARAQAQMATRQGRDRGRARAVADEVRGVLTSTESRARSNRTPSPGSTRPGTHRATGRPDALEMDDLRGKLGMRDNTMPSEQTQTPEDRAISKILPSGVRGLPPSLSRRWGRR